MQVTIAKNAGFCFGVRRATDSLEAAIEAKRPNEKIYTLGHLIHNKPYNDELAARGVECISVDDIDRLEREAGEHPVTLFVRAHGIPREDEKKLLDISCTKPNFKYVLILFLFSIPFHGRFLKL